MANLGKESSARSSFILERRVKVAAAAFSLFLRFTCEQLILLAELNFPFFFTFNENFWRRKGILFPF